MSLRRIAQNKVASYIATLSALFGCVFMGIISYRKMVNGEGFEHYISMSGLQLSYYQVLFWLFLIPAVWVLMSIVEYFSYKDERDFKRKYKIKD